VETHVLEWPLSVHIHQQENKTPAQGPHAERAGRFTRPQGQLTLTMSANEPVRKDLMHFLDVLQKAA
jgi:hypothetical protein